MYQPCFQRSSLAAFLLLSFGFGALTLGGCRSAYYKTMETFGVQKRHILVDRVEEGRDAQEKASEQFQTALEVFKDVALAPLPVGEVEARDMLGQLAGLPLLGSFRGQPAADVDALVDVMVRLARLASDHADTIAEIDLNPVLVHDAGRGVSVVDALIVKS